ncbi:MAG: hypothetical protein V3S71_08215 [Acidobacteriota bacterium]
MVCERVKPAVSGLEQEFTGKVRASNVDASTPEAREEIAALGFRNHGLVIRSADGSALWKQPDHEVSIDDVRKALRDLMGSEDQPRTGSRY